MKINSAKVWPYAIGGAILLVFGFCVATIVVTSSMPVENSDTNMMYYQEADANANELIKAKIAFDKEYKIEYVTDGINLDNSVLKYRIADLDNNPVDNAEIKVIITRPNNHKHDQTLENPSFVDGIYVFDSVTLPVAGRWDIMAKVNVGELQRFYNVKADTRATEAFEY